MYEQETDSIWGYTVKGYNGKSFRKQMANVYLDEVIRSVKGRTGKQNGEEYIRGLREKPGKWKVIPPGKSQPRKNTSWHYLLPMGANR